MTAAPVETVRLNERAKTQLTTLKRRTGIKNWNTLSRWALCVSLAEPTVPAAIIENSDIGVEMTWSTFGGRNADLYAALIRARCDLDGLGTSSDVIATQFRLHLHRGITYLIGLESTKSLEGLVQLAV